MESKIKRPADALIYALDADSKEEAAEWVDRLKGSVGMFKVGFQLFLRSGPPVIEMIKELGGRVFLDLKFHDIPHTVGRAAREAVRMGVDMFNVHVSGGDEMMMIAGKSARDEAARLGIPAPVVLGVTVLTSLDNREVAEVGFHMSTNELVLHLAGLSKQYGLDGVVASTWEAAAIREAVGPQLTIVCPGIRPSGSDKGDQARAASPEAAILAGADYLVVGRPIKTAPDPEGMAKKIVEEIAGAMATIQS